MNYTQIKMWHLLCAAFLKANTNSQIPIAELMDCTTVSVILSELQRVEESTHIDNCNANIWCEDPSAPFHSAQDDKTGEFAIKAICRIPYAERKLATESGDTQWPCLIAGLPVTKLSAATRRQIPYAERKLASESGDTQWPYLIAGLSVTKLSAGTARKKGAVKKVP